MQVRRRQPAGRRLPDAHRGRTAGLPTQCFVYCRFFRSYACESLKSLRCTKRFPRNCTAVPNGWCPI
ncbi:protein of unknown function [Burkholderia multivorans]